MSLMIMCDRCKKIVYADSRNDEGDYATIDLMHGNESIRFHLCSVCHDALRTQFMKKMKWEG